MRPSSHVNNVVKALKILDMSGHWSKTSHQYGKRLQYFALILQICNDSEILEIKKQLYCWNILEDFNNFSNYLKT